MKKVLKRPWIWIPTLDLLILSFGGLFLAVLNALEGVLPEQTFFALEEYYALRLKHGVPGQGVLALCMLLAALISGGRVFFERGKTVSRKITIAFGYLLLGVVSMLLLLPPCCVGRERAKRISCGSNLKQIRLSLVQYTIDYDDCFPPDLAVLNTHDYLTDEYIYRCPSCWGRENPEFTDYLYYGKSRKITDPPFLLLEDRNRNHPGNFHNRVFSDGTFSSGR